MWRRWGKRGYKEAEREDREKFIKMRREDWVEPKKESKQVDVCMVS